MRLLLFALLALAALAAACENTYPPEYPPRSSYSYEQKVYPTTVLEVAGEAPVVSNAPGQAQVAQGDPSRVLVLQSTHLDRPAEVVGVIDAHVPMGSHDAALDVVRKRAAAMGADAVVGVEFHHGEGEGEPTHLSGLAVRFLQTAPYPVDR